MKFSTRMVKSKLFPLIVSLSLFPVFFLLLNRVQEVKIIGQQNPSILRVSSKFPGGKLLVNLTILIVKLSYFRIFEITQTCAVCQ